MAIKSSDAARYAALARRLRERSAEGKTYTLFGRSESTDDYYGAVAALADRAMQRSPDVRILISRLRESGSSVIRLRRLIKRDDAGDPVVAILHDAREHLSPYTTPAPDHLAALGGARRVERVLRMSEEQHQLAMLEVELMNRSNRGRFLSAAARLALLPHCLRDGNADCRAESDGIDEVCRSCSADCWINAIDALLRTRGIQPYIWMRAELRRLLRTVGGRDGFLGVLGIACIPELVRGMRRCERHGIPAVGIPLNGNRCARWMGSWHQTSINLARLEALVGR